METYKLSPREVAEIPYKKMQEILLIRKAKNEASRTQANLEKVKRQLTRSSGQTKRYREL